MRIAVIGGGIVGVATALRLLDDGHAVDIIDRIGVATGASRGNAGWIAHTDIIPLASPKVWRHLPGWLIDPVGPMTVRVAYLPTLAPWLLRFVAASRPGAIAANTRAIAALNGLALAAWERRLQAAGLGHVLRRAGILSVWSNGHAFEAFKPSADRQRGFGITVDLMDGAEVRSMEPALGPAAVAGAFYPTGCHVADPHELTVKLAEGATARGARMIVADVRGFSSTDAGVALVSDPDIASAYDRVVVATGAWAKGLAKASGDAVPLDTERGYNITLKPGALGVTRPVMFEGHGFVITPLDTGDRIGGSVEFAGLAAAPNFGRVDAMLARARRFLPHMPEGEGQRWMGFRPSLPDSLPVIGPAARDPRITYAFGHGHHGLTQAAVTADLVADILAARPAAIDLAPYSPARFRT